MSSELIVLNQNTEVQTQSNQQVGGLGVDFSNKLFNLKPATVTIVQPNSQLEGVVKGKLRISETGDQFDEMVCTLLVMPSEQRQYHIGNREDMNRTAENLVCWSNDLIKPDPKSKIPQAMTCASCSRSDWGPWREFKEKNGFTKKELIPPCDSHYQVYLIDTVYRMPLRMFIRSKGRETFEQGMNNLARLLAMAKAQGKNPNIFDVKFKLKTKQITTGKFLSYVPTFTDFEFVKDDEKEVFGAVYMQYINQLNRATQQEEIEAEQEAISESQKALDKVVEGEYIDDKEIEI